MAKKKVKRMKAWRGWCIVLPDRTIFGRVNYTRKSCVEIANKHGLETYPSMKNYRIARVVVTELSPRSGKK